MDDKMISVGEAAAKLVADLERHRVDTSTPEGRASWLALRLSDVTASDIGALAGVDPYKSAATVWAEKKGYAIQGAETDAMRRGRWMEAANFEALREKFPSWQIRRGNVYARQRSLRLGCTIDFIAVDPERDGVGIIQAKNIAKPIFEQWSETGELEIPLNYQLQTITEAMLIGAQWAMLSVIVTGTFTAELHTFEIALHEGAWTRVKELVRQFWTDMEAGKEPRLDYTRDAAVVRALHPPGRDVADPLDLTANNHLPVLCAERDALKASIKAQEERVEAIDAELKHAMGDHVEAMLADGRKLSHKTQFRKAYTVAETSFKRLNVGKPRAA